MPTKHSKEDIQTKDGERQSMAKRIAMIEPGFNPCLSFPCGSVEGKARLDYILSYHWHYSEEYVADFFLLSEPVLPENFFSEQQQHTLDRRLSPCYRGSHAL